MEHATFVSKDTLEQLDWPWALEQIRSHLRSALAVDLCAEEIWLADRESAALVMREVEEARSLFRLGIPPPMGSIPDIRPQQRLVEKGGVLSPSELLETASWMDTLETIRRFLVVHRQKVPVLHRHAATAPSLSHLVYDIRSSIDEAGELRDEASPELAALRKTGRRLNEEIHARLDSYLNAKDYEDLLQDRYYTLKEERYVLPIKTNRRSFVDGIVLGSSNSGATLFIEPREIVDLNNSHKLVLLEMHKETNRILMGICEHIQQETQELARGHRFLTHMDMIFARAQFADALQAATPGLAQDEGIRLLKSRHPILAMRKDQVVPNDIFIEPPIRTLLVTGPNAGGKTAVLKTVGLFALMVRAGLPLPVAPGSNMPFFDCVFSDIGDSQSIERDLSTFSGHVVRLRDFLLTRPAFSLALLDEIMIGTDPDEGSALAQAVLEHLTETGGISLATTHFVLLKSMAIGRPHIRNVSLGFEPKTFEPTYRLSEGIPGTSNALHICEHLELPASILDRAAALMDRSGTEIRDLVMQIQTEVDRARSERARCEEERVQAEALRKDLETRVSSVQEREKEMRRKFRDKLDIAFQEAMNDLMQWKRRRKVDSLKDSPAPSLTQARKDLGIIRDRLMTEDGPFHLPADPSCGKGIVDWTGVRRGDIVFLPELKTEARVVDPPNRKGIVTVEAGGLRMQVDKGKVYEPGVKQKVIGSMASAPPGRTTAVRPQRRNDTEDTSVLERCDLRGLTVEEALDAVSKGLDTGFHRQLPVMVIIHGLGTGALRNAVREYLAGAPYPCAFRPGRRGEGGDGVTVVEFNYIA